MAARYLKGAQGSDESRAFLRFVIRVAVGGVALGVATLLLALAIVHGFSEEIRAKIMGFGAHVQVESVTANPLVADAALVARAEASEGAIHVAPVVLEFALLRARRDAVEGVQLWGTDALPEYLAETVLGGGSADLIAPDSGSAPLVVGSALAGQLDLSVGDRVAAVSVDDVERGRGFRLASFHVGGIYESLLADFDALYVFIPISSARDLFEYGPEEVTRLDITLADPETAPSVARALEADLGYPAMSRTIFEVYRSLFAWVRLQESIIPLVLSIIALVAAFNVVGILLMVLLEKTRAIGLFKSLGASSSAIRTLFLWLGFGIGLVGCLLGVCIALLLAWLQLRYALIPLPAEAYYLDRAPISLRWRDVVLVVSVTLTLCTLAAYIPARIAARVDPIRAIRFR